MVHQVQNDETNWVNIVS